MIGFSETFVILEIQVLWDSSRYNPRTFLMLFLLPLSYKLLNPSYIVFIGHRKPFDLHFLIQQPLLQPCTFYPWEDNLRNWLNSLQMLWTILSSGLEHGHANLLWLFLYPAVLVCGGNISLIITELHLSMTDFRGALGTFFSSPYGLYWFLPMSISLRSSHVKDRGKGEETEDWVLLEEIAEKAQTQEHVTGHLHCF